jgi:organic radical activating enzyme
MTASYTLTCDGCDTGYTWTKRFGGISLSDARKQLAKEDGWHVTREPYTYTSVSAGEITRNAVRDICASCWAQGIR